MPTFRSSSEMTKKEEEMEGSQRQVRGESQASKAVITILKVLVALIAA